MRRRFLLLLGFLCLLATAGLTTAQPGWTATTSPPAGEPRRPISSPLLIEEVARQEPGDRLEVLEARDLPLDDVLSAPEEAWQPAAALSLDLGGHRGSYWLRLPVRNATPVPLTRTVVADYPAANRISLFVMDAEGHVRQEFADVGVDQAFIERGVNHRRAITSLQLAAGESALLLWQVESHPLFRFRAALWEPQAFQRHDHNRSLLFGMLYGALLIMAVYNLFLWVSLREKHYLFYVIYLLCTGYAVGAEEGHVQQYLLPGEAWPKTAMLTLVNMLAVAAFYGFSAAFLRLRRNQRLLFRWMRGLALVNIGLLLLGGILDQSWAMRLALVAILPFYLLALGAGVRLRLRGFLPAGYYVAAVLLLVAGVGLNNLTMLGLLPGNDAVESYNAIGTVLMTAFFSLALANRINQLQRDSDTAAAGIAHANREIHRINNELVKARAEWARLDQAFATARQESHAKSEFLASLGHEIRTPLNGLLGMAELLGEGELDDNQRHYLQVIERSGRTLLEVTGDMMDYSILEAGALDLDVETFELETLIDDCIAIFTRHSAEQRIALFAEIEEDVGLLLRGDRRKLQQVLLNLISNAFKFTDSGDIVVRVGRTKRTAINSIELRFEVRDTGIGLSEQMRDELFNPFGASDDNGARSHHLGLAICRQLVELMDGEIGADGSPGHGATFWFTARLLTTPGEVTPPQPLTQRHLVLMAGPSLVRDAMARMLQRWGAVVAVAVDAEEALPLLEHCDALLVEERLIDGSRGLAALEALRQQLALPPTLLLTTAAPLVGSAELTPEDATRAGVTTVLEKPVGLRLLRHSLCRALGLGIETAATGDDPDASTDDRAG